MPATRATRISDRDHQRLQRLAEETRQSHVDVLSQALDLFEREHFFDALDAGFHRLRADPKAWQEELEERALWDQTLGDGDRDE
jgi:predicted transcriptional regulator